MKMGRREVLASTIALALGGCGGSSSGASSPIPVTPAPSPSPSPSPSPTPTPTPSPTPAPSYPSYNTNPIPADPTGMTSTATDIAARITLGMNIGNTLEAVGGETAWGNPKITQGLIAGIKAAGFDAIRLPCSWNQYADQATAAISASWLDRVKEVVQYCINADMHVLLNIHWDGGWLENNVTADKKDAVIAKQKAFWEQIATHMRDFDERLMFASANEPNCDTAEQMEILYTYHQACIDAVRSTGGRNAYRIVVVQAPNTNIDLTKKLWYRMPTDPAANRLMMEVHYYEPTQFCILTEDASWGKMFYYWGKDYHSTIEPDRNATYGEEDTVDQEMAIEKQQFISQGIPVIMGEYGAVKRSNPLDLKLHLASRAHWLEYVTQQARANGLLPFLWDTGDYMDRNTYTIKDQQGMDAVLQGAGKK